MDSATLGTLVIIMLLSLLFVAGFIVMFIEILKDFFE